MGIFKKAEIKKNYDLAQQLGSGNFAVVHKATCKKKDGPIPFNTDVAIKIIDKAKVEDMNDIQREIEIMGILNHKHVIKLYEIYDEPKKMKLVMELVQGGELFDKIVSMGQYTEKQAAKVMYQLCDALKYMHAPERNVVHRDLKPENILLESDSEDADIKVADFGLARVVSNKDMMKTACGTPGYVAPEVLQNKGYTGGAVDCWSVGVILYILLCGFTHFYHESTAALYKQIKKGAYDFPDPYWTEISEDAKDLVTRLLNIDPKKRYKPKDVLSHAWIAGEAPSTQFSDAHNRNFVMLQARRTLRKGVRSIIAVNRFSRQLRATLDEEKE